MLFVLIFAISFLANTISVEMFQALEFTCSVHYVFFWQFFSYSIYNQCQGKSERPSGRLKLTSKSPRPSRAKDEMSFWRLKIQKIFGREYPQTSLAMCCHFSEFYPPPPRLSSWKCFEWPFPRKGCTSLL